MGREFGEEWVHAYVLLSPLVFTWNYHNVVCLSAKNIYIYKQILIKAHDKCQERQ